MRAGGWQAPSILVMRVVAEFVSTLLRKRVRVRRLPAAA